MPRKVEVDVFRICWRESWKSLKPPKYLYLKVKEPKARIVRFTSIELPNSRKYKPEGHESITERTSCPYNWSQSWKQVQWHKLMALHENRLKPLLSLQLVLVMLYPSNGDLLFLWTYHYHNGKRKKNSNYSSHDHHDHLRSMLSSYKPTVLIFSKCNVSATTDIRKCNSGTPVTISDMQRNIPNMICASYCFVRQ